MPDKTNQPTNQRKQIMTTDPWVKFDITDKKYNNKFYENWLNRLNCK